MMFGDFIDSSVKYVYHLIWKNTLGQRCADITQSYLLHFQLSGGCLVHLQTKWAASLHYTVASAFILGFQLRTLAVIKNPSSQL